MTTHISRNTKHTSRGDALGLWYEVTLAGVRDKAPDLTARQLAVMMTVYLVPAPHTVRSLAVHLNVTKAVVTRALDTLGRHGFADRARDPNDGRSVLVQRTGLGSSYLTGFADSIRGAVKSEPARPTRPTASVEHVTSFEIEAA